MKRIIPVVTLICLSLSIFATEVDLIGPKGTKESSTVDSDIQTLKLAYDLANYGYTNESASALLQAAEILAQIPKQPADVTAVKEGKKGESATTTKNFSPDQLVKDAKQLASRDKVMLSWATDIEKSLKTITRGASGGALYDADFVYAYGGTSWYNWYFDANRLAEIGIHSMDGADLDLYIYDENGNLIAYDERTTPGAYCSFHPRWTGVFKVIIKNNARYNATYEIFTN